ncbi:MAG: hypothetical protein QNJ54_31430 [Prochloraceae cyanobacterium]|nr:hypothetical protein [Prochloraceae cyanobacterium]
MQATTGLSQKIEQSNSKIANLKEALRAEENILKGLQEQVKLIDKGVTTLKTIFDKLSGSSEAIATLTQQLLGILNTGQTSEDFDEELVEQPNKEPRSNEFFSWQQTSNEAVSSYFNVTKGIVQATYIGSNSKLLLEALSTKLLHWIPGISTKVRKAKHLQFTYELKIVRLDDDTTGWLTALDFSKPITPQLQLDLSECPQEYLLGQSYQICCLLEDNHQKPTRPVVVKSAAEKVIDKNVAQNDNLPFPSYAIVKKKLERNNLCYQVLDKGATKDFLEVWCLSTGKKERIRAKYLQQIELPSSYYFWTNKTDETIEDPIFQCLAVYYRWRFSECQTLKELEKLKLENSSELAVLKWAYNHLPDEERTRIDSICNDTPKKVSDPLGSKIGERVEIVSARHGQELVGKVGIITAGSSQLGVVVAIEGYDKKFFLRNEIKPAIELIAG